MGFVTTVVLEMVTGDVPEVRNLCGQQSNAISKLAAFGLTGSNTSSPMVRASLKCVVSYVSSSRSYPFELRSQFLKACSFPERECGMNAGYVTTMFLYRLFETTRSPFLPGI